MDKNSFSMSIDLAGQNLTYMDPGQVYIGNLIIGRFLIGFGSMLGYSGDYLDMFRAGPQPIYSYIYTKDNPIIKLHFPTK